MSEPRAPDQPAPGLGRVETIQRDEEQQPEPELIAVPSGEYAKYLVEQAGRIAGEKNEKRDARYRAFTTVVLAVLAFVGLRSLSDIKSDLNASLAAGMKSEQASLLSSFAELRHELRSSVPAAVGEEFARQRLSMVQDTVNAIQEGFDAKLAFLQLTALVTKMDSQPGIDAADRDAALSLFRKASTSSDLRSSPEFTATAEMLVGVLFKADLEENVDLVESLLGDVAATSSKIVMTMVSDYGMRCIGSAQIEPDAVARFRKYAEAANARNIRAMSLAFELGVAFREAGYQRNQVGESLLEDASRLIPAGGQIFVSQVDQLAAITEDSPDANGKLLRVGRAFRDLQTVYEEEFHAIRARFATASSESPSLGDLLEALKGLEVAPQPGDNDG